MSLGKRSPARPSIHRMFLDASYLLCRGADFSEGRRVPAVVWTPDGREELTLRGEIGLQHPPGTTPVQRAGPGITCRTVIESGLVHVILAYRRSFWRGHLETIYCDLACSLQ